MSDRLVDPHNVADWRAEIARAANPIWAAPPVPVAPDPVTHPPHYTSHPSGVECIEITRHMGFNLGNAMKYIWRADIKGSAIQDLEKARWYIDDEIAKRTAAK
jgi:hypothetical protein